MPRETSESVADELEILLREEGDRATGSLLALSNLKSVMACHTDTANYTHSRAVVIRSLALKMKSLLAVSRYDDMSYADKARALLAVSDGYLKLAHAFKTDQETWSVAQKELVPYLAGVSDEEAIDCAVQKLENHLDSYLKSLQSWLEK